jgi:MFS family permease
MTQYNTPTGTTGSTAPSVGVVAAVSSPADRIRWGSIIGGLFAALSTIVLLGVLGMAIGLTALDPGDRPGEGFAWGAAIWTIITFILAFFIGGWVAGRTAAFQNHRHGLLNGAMVWATSVALVVMLLGSGISALVGAGGQALGTMAGEMGNDARPASARIDAALPDMNADQQDLQRADRAATTSAWVTLVSLLIGLGAAAFGGYSGSRGSHDHDRHPARD